MKKRTRVQRVQVNPGANPGKALISTALKPVWKSIFFLNKRNECGEHFVHIEGVVGSSPTVTTEKSVRTGTQMGYANAKKVRTLTGESYTSTIGR